MSRPSLRSTTYGLLMVATLLFLTSTTTHAQVCQDFIWEDGEYCGFDARTVTGVPEMNHDCVNNVLDIDLFIKAFSSPSYNPSADFNGDRVVDLMDATIFASSYAPGQPVSPCNPDPPVPETCEANLSLSFETSSIVSRANAPLGLPFNYYVIASGWTDATTIELALETSPHIVILSTSGPPGWVSGMIFNNGNIKYQSWHSTGTLESGTTVVIAFQALLITDLPATIELVDFDSPNDVLIRWAPDGLTQRSTFQVRRNLGINIIDPISTTACPTPNTSPDLAITDPSTDIGVPYGSSPYPLAGTALDTDGTLDFVEYRNNNGTWLLASGTDTWSASVPLVMGANWIQVRCADTLGGYSSTQVVTITRLEAPDLAITYWDAPLALWTGCEEVSVAATCANIASGASAGPSRLGFYLSPDQTIDTNDFLVGWVDLLSIAAGEDTLVAPLIPIPDSGLRGPLYFGVLADDLNEVGEGDETNNDASSVFDFPVPAITSIVDVANDQGRWVRLNTWSSSYDVPGSPTPILQYEAFRRIDELPQPIKAASVEFPVAGKQISSLTKTAGWEFAGAIPAHVELEYNMIVPTLADSTDQGIHESVFFVRAATADPGVFYDSCPAEGYSIDNLPPSVPAGLLAAYSATGVQLAWEASLDEDFRYFRIYRGSHEQFMPDASNLVQATTETSWLDGETDPWGHFYRISAVDHAGNESPTTAPHVITGTPDLPSTPVKYALHQCVPNPFNPRTVIRYDLPTDAFVTLNIYASNGRLVISLVSQQIPAGTHEVMWDGKDRFDRQVATGLYFYRLEAHDFAQTRRMVLLK